MNLEILPTSSGPLKQIVNLKKTHITKTKQIISTLISNPLRISKKFKVPI